MAQASDQMVQQKLHAQMVTEHGFALKQRRVSFSDIDEVISVSSFASDETVSTGAALRMSRRIGLSPQGECGVRRREHRRLRSGYTPSQRPASRVQTCRAKCQTIGDGCATASSIAEPPIIAEPPGSLPCVLPEAAPSLVEMLLEDVKVETNKPKWYQEASTFFGVKVVKLAEFIIIAHLVYFFLCVVYLVQARSAVTVH